MNIEIPYNKLTKNAKVPIIPLKLASLDNQAKTDTNLSNVQYADVKNNESSTYFTLMWSIFAIVLATVCISFLIYYFILRRSQSLYAID